MDMNLQPTVIHRDLFPPFCILACRLLNASDCLSVVGHKNVYFGLGQPVRTLTFFLFILLVTEGRARSTCLSAGYVNGHGCVCKSVLSTVLTVLDNKVRISTILIYFLGLHETRDFSSERRAVGNVYDWLAVVLEVCGWVLSGKYGAPT